MTKIQLGLLLVLLIFPASAVAQEVIPSPPANRTLIYILDSQNNLVPLPFEAGQTPLHPDVVARSEKVSYIDVKGEHAATAMSDDTPRFFLFTAQGAPHPPFLVWLEPHRGGSRRVAAVAQKGMRGFAIASEQIVKPTIRVLVQAGDMVFMEVRPRASLVPGEYAIIGDDLARIATFRVTAKR